MLPTPTLRTARLVLRPFTGADAGPLYDLMSDAYALRYWDAPPWSERARAERNPAHRSASLGYCLAPAAWGHGYATEAAAALVGWGLEAMDLNRVQAYADTRNAASRRVLEKLGFALEGTLREDCVVDGEVSDSWVFGLLRREFVGVAGQRPGGDERE